MLIKYDNDIWLKFEAIVKAKFVLGIKEDFEIPLGVKNMPSTQHTIWGLIEQYADDPRNLKILEVYHKKIRG